MRRFSINAQPYLYHSLAYANLVKQSVNHAGLMPSLAFLEDCPDDSRRGWIVSVYNGESFKGYASHA